MRASNKGKKCSIDGCDRDIASRGLCVMHRKREWRKEPGKLCSIPGCGMKHDARGYCSRHYQKFHDFGDPLAGRDTFDGEPLKWLRSNLNYNNDECLEWPYGKMPTGYGSITPIERGRSNSTCAHIIMCQEAHGPKPSSKHQVAHSCGNRACVNPRHLRWATQSENEADKVAHGRLNYARGERCGGSKLTENQVLKIFTDARSLGEIAMAYGIDKTTVGAIRNGKTWSWLTKHSS